MRAVPKSREISAFLLAMQNMILNMIKLPYLVHAVLKLGSRLMQNPFEDLVTWRTAHGVLKEGHNVWVHLANDEVVHVEEFRKLIHRKVAILQG